MHTCGDQKTLGEPLYRSHLFLGGGVCPKSRARIFSARLEACKPSDPPFSAILRAGVTGMHTKSSMLHGCWDSDSVSQDCAVSTPQPLNRPSSPLLSEERHECWEGSLLSTRAPVRGSYSVRGESSGIFSLAQSALPRDSAL